MAYVAVRGGEEAIAAASALYRGIRLGSPEGASLPSRGIEDGLPFLIDQAMSEGSIYDPEGAAAAIKQAMGSMEEAVFLLRAYRSTLPRLRSSLPLDPASARLERRISACFKDIPGGQLLGPTSDYTHRILDLAIATDAATAAGAQGPGDTPISPSGGTIAWGPFPKVSDYLRAEGLLASLPDDDREPLDVTKKSLEFPATRAERLQILARGMTGAVIALGYAALRGYGILHPTVSELRVGLLPVLVACDDEDEEEAHFLGEARITEAESLVPIEIALPGGGAKIEFELGYGACFGRNESKAIAMSLLDQCLERADPRYPTHDEEFVLLHVDAVEATGFISHLKLPHYVTFQSKLDALRKAREGAR
jgi:alpha-D-ribose 1-methylphosphonate 5-triphosphate synthase subunit PhnI